MITTLFRIPVSVYAHYVEAVANGLLYGFITWLVFFVINRKMDKALSADSKELSKKKREI